MMRFESEKGSDQPPVDSCGDVGDGGGDDSVYGDKFPGDGDGCHHWRDGGDPQTPLVPPPTPQHQPVATPLGGTGAIDAFARERVSACKKKKSY